MPAVDLARLKRQLTDLGEYFYQPALFNRHLHELFFFYADRTIKPTPAGKRAPLLPHYNISEPILRQLEKELTRRMQDATIQDVLSLADALWREGYFEFRLVAAYILGQVGPEGKTEVVSRLQAWAQPDEDARIVKGLFTAGKTSLGKGNQDIWIGQIVTWIDGESVSTQELGLRALQTVVADPHFENLPKIYKLLMPVASSAPPALHADIAAVVEILARRSQPETVTFLKTLLTNTSNPNMTRLVRRCVPFFNEGNQQKLRTALAQKVT